MNESGVYEISVPDGRLSELIDAVHRAAEHTESAGGRRPRNISIADLDVGVGAPDSDTRRRLVGIVVRADGDVRADVVFDLDGATAIARFSTTEPDSDNLAALRQLSFVRYLATTTVTDLNARGVAAELTRLAVA